MQQYQLIGEPISGFPDEYAVPRILAAAETESWVMSQMPPKLRICLARNLDTVRATAIAAVYVEVNAEMRMAA